MNHPDHECPAGLSLDERQSLPVEQGVLLWCIRMSVIEMKRGIRVSAGIEELLDALGAPSASPHMRDFMIALSRGCTRMIDVRCVCQKQLSHDERALLDALSLVQEDRSFEALLLLRGFVTHAGVDTALRSAEGICLALASAGCFLPEPKMEVSHYALSTTGTGGLAMPRRATLH